LALVTKYQGNWQAISSSDMVKNANAISKALLDFGIQPNDKVAIITNRSRNEWRVTDYAITQIGAINVPIYDSTSSYDIQYIFNHAEVKLCFVANEDLYQKVNKIASSIPTLDKIITFDEIKNIDTYKDILQLGKNLNNDKELALIKNAIVETDLATIIYTSGTTDKPKGVMLSHKNILSNIEALESVIPVLPKNPKSLSFLPVSHIFERMMLYLYQSNGISIYFAESIDSISNDIKTVKPHVMTAVPRVIEKIHDKILEKSKDLGMIKRKLFDWALGIGYQYEADGKNGSKYEKNLSRARKLVFSKWKDALGGNIHAIFCGSSKLAPELSRIFNAAGFNLMDGYGLTETSPVISVNAPYPNRNKIGTIGKPIDNVTVKIDTDNQILIKGPNVMIGYYKDPEKTKKSMKDGYFQTGDLGKLDNDGFLYITGRKKENFKTSGGKYINPEKIEIALKKSKYMDHAVVIGENEKFPALILQPNFELLQSEIPELKTSSYLDICANDKVHAIIEKELEKVNEDLGQWEKIKKFECTPEIWSIESGHLTPTLKVKRDIIKAKYYSLFNKIYRPQKS
ncbi:MAG TPA: long-chain fatty acid--CoA ligase, partial [Flavobacteriia bacterium]|nr:long-chain fatty acid--CoA ligase [Flavobacteriia bacterium]